MNYSTEDYNPNRITSKKLLELPLSLKSDIGNEYTPPNIWNGVLYRIKPRKSVILHSERDLEEISLNEEEPYVRGAFGFTDNSFLVQSRNEKVVELSCLNANKIAEFDLGVIDSPQSISVDSYYIVMSKERRELGFPIALSRKEMTKSEFTWSFNTENVVSGFALADDQRNLVITDYRGGIYLLDVESGEVIWQQDAQSIGVLTLDELNHPLGNGKVNDLPHIYKNTVAFGYLFSYLVGIDLQSGAVKWKRKFSADSLAYTTVSSEGRQYYLSHHSEYTRLYVIDCETGESIKEFDIDLDSAFKDRFSSSVYSDITDTHFWGVAANGGLLYAINLKTGKMDWHYDLKGNLTHNPFFICNNRLYITTYEKQFIFEGVGGYIPD